MYSVHLDPDVAFKALTTDNGTDVFAWDNLVWSRAGVVTPTGTEFGSLSTRNSFPARRAATCVLQEIMGLRADATD